MKNDLVHTVKGEVFTSSVSIAEKLEVPHSNLLRTIEKIINRQKNNHPARGVFFSQIFKEISFTNKMNRTYKAYDLNEQAFVKVVMHLAGYEKAEYIQDLFIEAFYKMKQQLLNQHNVSWIEKRETGKATRLIETDTIKEFVEYATRQGSQSAFRYYGNITKMTNKALELLIQTKNGKPLRDLATVTELGFIQIVDDRATLCIKDGMNRELPYKEIYIYAKEEVEKLIDSLAFKRLE